MKKLMVVALFISLASAAYATSSTKGETAHPVFKHQFTFE